MRLRRRVIRLLLWLGAIAAIITAGAIHGQNHTLAVLDPQGPVADKERQLMLDAVLLGLIVVIPVFIMLFGFAWRYREKGHQKARYSPEFAGSPVLETIWWGVPLVIISILSVLTWNSSHELDPFRPLASKTPAMEVQVVALQWKWLFLYPQQHVATVNYLMIPVNRPVHFDITADAPMNSFWIPQLGGQIYAMSGMVTQLNLEASKRGTYYGSSANISGNGFAGMHFTAYALPVEDFTNWSQNTAALGTSLSTDQYTALAKPSIDNPLGTYGGYAPGLFDSVVTKYMPAGMDMSTEGAH